jgi:hypothetical protein
MNDKDVPWELKLAVLKDERKMIKEFMALVLPDYPMYAKQYKAFFDALVNAGFTPEQALDIIKTQGWMAK